MHTKLFYFSATGNSLSFARTIAHSLGETELVAISQTTEYPIITGSQRIGLIFPVYAWGLPRIVADFVSKLEVKDSAGYFFAVATCVGTPGGTMLQLKRLLNKKGIELDAGFVVGEVNHSPLKQVPVEKLVIWLARNSRPKPARERIQEIVGIIKKNGKAKPETSSRLSCLLGTTFLHKAVINSFKTNDQYFSADNTCNKCNICIKVCPRNNIQIENQKVKWHNNCELCIACYNWCPQNSIHHKNEETGYRRRTHNMEIELKDMIRND